MFFLACLKILLPTKIEFHHDCAYLTIFHVYSLQKELTHTIHLHPSYFGPSMPTYLKKKLHSDVEGTCSGRFGYIITVVALQNIGRGKVLPGSGLAEFNVKYQAIVFKPYKGEVVDAVVTTVNKMGFFADVGPLQVFVSQHLIPNDMKFDPNGNPPCYQSEDQQVRCLPRLRPR
ncbi:RNA polymerase Rpb7 [Jimgerdemannia flammicorona]|uniref:RNA polymerase Rpb7 n=1 Tax=Jimgerdemannia flammicorona TaxID=994334 RepID=A0A433D868_9FUNG|nr:RNA polymerase Rpb7 [Jimgerdemannia flammicorona]